MCCPRDCSVCRRQAKEDKAEKVRGTEKVRTCCVLRGNHRREQKKGKSREKIACRMPQPKMFGKCFQKFFFAHFFLLSLFRWHRLAGKGKQQRTESLFRPKLGKRRVSFLFSYQCDFMEILSAESLQNFCLCGCVRFRSGDLHQPLVNSG